MRTLTVAFAPTLCATLFALMAIGCAPKQTEDGSDVKFGFRNGFSGNGPAESLYQVRPNQTIGICANNVKSSIAEDIKAGVKMWMTQAGRAEHVSIIDSCQADRVIKLQYTNATPYAQTWPLSGNSNLIEIGQNYAPKFTGPHEVGHVIGFCDLYNPSSCRNNSGDSRPSLMGSGNLNGGVLSEADRQGIVSMINQPELTGSTAEWKDFLTSNTSTKTAIFLALDDQPKGSRVWVSVPSGSTGLRVCLTGGLETCDASDSETLGTAKILGSRMIYPLADLLTSTTALYVVTDQGSHIFKIRAR